MRLLNNTGGLAIKMKRKEDVEIGKVGAGLKN